MNSNRLKKRVGAVKKQSGTGGSVIRLEYPPPEHLAELAMAETDRRILDAYADTIRFLRNGKHFSFREIAEWLTENGVEVDHNAVYRVYTKGLSEFEKAEVENEPNEDGATEG